MKKQQYPFWYRHSRVVLWLGIILLILLGGLLLIWPKAQNVMAGGLYDADQKKVELESIKSQLNRVKDASSMFRAIPQAQKDAIEVFLPSEDKIPLLMKQLELLARDHGLIVRSLEFGQLMAQESGRTRSRDVMITPFTESLQIDGIGALQIKMVVAPGDYETIKPFVLALEKYQRLLDVTSFTIERSTDAGIGETTIEIRTYYLADQ